jgi:hypoxanthine-guanine phosphoribosyltransferase
MQEQFPELDVGLVKDILEDEDGDLQYARSKLKVRQPFSFKATYHVRRHEKKDVRLSEST